MNNKARSILLWGTSMYTLTCFLNDPSTRIQILLSIGIAYLIYTTNQHLVTDRIHKNKVFRHLIPMLIMNAVLIPINVVVLMLNEQSFTRSHLLSYLLFNIIILLIYITQYLYFKRRVNKQLQTKISSLD